MTNTDPDREKTEQTRSMMPMALSCPGVRSVSCMMAVVKGNSDSRLVGMDEVEGLDGGVRKNV